MLYEVITYDADKIQPYGHDRYENVISSVA